VVPPFRRRSREKPFEMSPLVLARCEGNDIYHEVRAGSAAMPIVARRAEIVLPRFNILAKLMHSYAHKIKTPCRIADVPLCASKSGVSKFHIFRKILLR
jgi:hypothetical protein